MRHTILELIEVITSAQVRSVNLTTQTIENYRSNQGID